MVRKKERSSWVEDSTEREGGSHRWAVKGREVSIVMGVVSVEMKRLKAAERGWEMRVDRDVRRRDRAIFPHR